jgi:TP901 family phage tail tape measure protein
VDAQLAKVRAEAKGVKDELDNVGGGVMGFITKAAGFVGIQLGVHALVGWVKQLGTESINAAVKGSDSISDMEKSLNATTAEAKALRSQLENIDTRTSEENLENIAIAGGQLGRTKEEIVAFTQSVDQAVVTLGDEFSGGVEEVAKDLGGLQKLFKETANVSPADAITKIGSAINALGADGTATGPVIADFTARIGQLGDLAPEITQTLGLGAALQELGLTAEISAGGISNVLLTASKDTAGFGKQIGLTSNEFEELINNDPNEVLLRLAASLKGASNTEIITTLDGLNIKSQEAVKVVILLVNQTDIVRQKQALASAEYEKGTSLVEEFAKKNTNAAAEVEKAEKSFAKARLELGERLIPVYLLGLQTIGFFINVIKAIPGFLNENRGAILGLVVATLNAQQIALTASTLYNT